MRELYGYNQLSSANRQNYTYAKKTGQLYWRWRQQQRSERERKDFNDNDTEKTICHTWQQFKYTHNKPHFVNLRLNNVTFTACSPLPSSFSAIILNCVRNVFAVTLFIVKVRSLNFPPVCSYIWNLKILKSWFILVFVIIIMYSIRSNN